MRLIIFVCYRKSASWVDDEDFEGPGHNLNTHFDNKIYRDSYPKASGRKSESAIDLPNKNRAKYTADKKLGGGARRNTVHKKITNLSWLEIMFLLSFKRHRIAGLATTMPLRLRSRSRPADTR